MALARLKLLCRRAKALPADVLRLVRAYLCFYVQWHVPLWVEWLLEDKIRALPRRGTRSRSVLIVLATSARIPVADYRLDQDSLRDTGPLTRPFAVDYPVTVMVKIVVKYKPWESNLPQTRWELVCQQGIVVLRRVSSGWSPWGPLTALINIRNCFTTSAPYGHVEVPVTWPGWRRCVDRYLFGPAHRDLRWSRGATRRSRSVAIAAIRLQQHPLNGCMRMARYSAQGGASRPT